MAPPLIKRAIGNSASTTLASSVSNSDTSQPLTADTNFNAESGEGMVIIDEGAAAEEIAYSTTLSGSSLTTPLANRGLEGGSSQAHSSGATVKGILTAGMWNDLVDALLNVVEQTTGAIKDNLSFVKPTLNGSIHSSEALSTTTPTIDADQDSVFTITLTGNTTFAISNVSVGQFILVECKQGSGTSYTTAFSGSGFSSINWITTGGTLPTMTTTSNGYTTYGFRCTGSGTFNGYLVGKS